VVVADRQRADFAAALRLLGLKADLVPVASGGDHGGVLLLGQSEGAPALTPPAV
jgi:hypothetical protein